METITFYLQYALRSLRRGGQRTLLAMVCIAFGVMSLVALQIVTTSALDLFTVDPRASIGGDALIRRSGTLDQEEQAKLEQLRANGTISAYSPVSSPLSGVMKPTDDGQVYFVSRYLGVDPANYPLFGNYQITGKNNEQISLRNAIQSPDTAVVTRDVAAQFNLQVGSRIVLMDMRSNIPVRVQVTGIAQMTPDRRGDTVLYNLQTARNLTGSPNVANSAVIRWGAAGDRHEQLEQAGWTVWTPQDEVNLVASAVNLFSLLLRGAGVLGLLIGGIGVSNTIQVLLARRTLEIATLKTHGYRQRDLLALFGIETMLLGLAGGLVGAIIALAISSQLVTLFARTGMGLMEWRVDPLVVLGGILAGVATTMIFGLHAVVRASSVRPGMLLRNLPLPSGWRVRLASIALYLPLGVLFAALSSFILGSVIQGVGVVLFGLAGLAVLSLLLGAIFFVLVRLPTPAISLLTLARNSLKRQQTRAIFALIALFTGVFTIGFALTALSNGMERVTSRVQPDTGYNLTVYGTLSDDASIRKQLGTQAVQLEHTLYRMRIQATASDGTTIAGLTSMDGFAAGGTDWMIQLSDGTPADWMASPDAVLLPEQYRADPRNLKPGSVLTIVANNQQRQLRVAGYYMPKSTGAVLPASQGVVVSPALVEQLGGAATPVLYICQVPVERLNSTQVVMAQALPQAIIIGKDAFNESLRRSYENLYALVIAVAGLALVAGAVLVANAVGLAMVERRRELGILKAVGYTSRNVLSTILIENSLLGLIAGITGMGGVAVAIAVLNRLQPAADMHMNAVLAFAMIVVAIAIALASATLVAWHPTQVRPLEVLRNE